MKRKSTRTQGIKRKIALLLSIAMLFTLAFTGTALAASDQDYEKGPTRGSGALTREIVWNSLTNQFGIFDLVPLWDHSGNHSHRVIIENAVTIVNRDRNNYITVRDRDLMIHAGRAIDLTNNPHLVRLRGTQFRGFHGNFTSTQNGNWAASNYIGAFILISRIAERGGAANGLTHANAGYGLTPAEFNNIVSRFRRNGSDSAQGMIDDTGTFRTWRQIMESFTQFNNYASRTATQQRRDRRFFIWGIALHTLTDAFEHSAFVRIGVDIWRNYNTLTNDQQSSAVAQTRFNAARDAAVSALFFGVSRQNYGCCCDFLEASWRFSTLNFRLANLSLYANQASIVRRNGRGLNANERIEFRRGDIRMPTNVNGLTFSQHMPNRCSLHPNVAVEFCPTCGSV